MSHPWRLKGQNDKEKAAWFQPTPFVNRGADEDSELMITRTQEQPMVKPEGPQCIRLGSILEKTGGGNTKVSLDDRPVA